MKAILSLVLAVFVFSLAPKAHAADKVPHFGYVAPGWVAVPPGAFDLTPVWSAFGFPESGLSYAFVGGPSGSSPFWERFDPSGTTYEAFFGAYVIKNWPFASDWNKPHVQVADVTRSANELIALGNLDQLAWLSFYNAYFGGPTGSSYVDGSLHIFPADDGFFLLTFLIDTFSDFGTTTPPAPWEPAYSPASGVSAWQPIRAEASVLVTYDPASGDFLAIYGSGASYTMADGSKENTPLGTFVQIARMMAATSFQ